MLGKFNVQDCHNCAWARSTNVPPTLRYFAKRMPVYCPFYGYIKASDTDRDCKDWMPEEEGPDDE